MMRRSSSEQNAKGERVVRASALRSRRELLPALKAFPLPALKAFVVFKSTLWVLGEGGFSL